MPFYFVDVRRWRSMEEDLLEQWDKDNPKTAEKFINILSELITKYRPELESMKY